MDNLRETAGEMDGGTCAGDTEDANVWDRTMQRVISETHRYRL